MYVAPFSQPNMYKCELPNNGENPIVSMSPSPSNRVSLMAYEF